MGLYRISFFTGIIAIMFLIGCRNNPTQKQTVDSRVKSLPFYNEATFTPVWSIQDLGMTGEFHQIPPFRVINQLGDTITEETFENKIYVADFFFTSCPGICAKMTSNMLLVQEAFRHDDSVLLLSHSVTPEYDSVSMLKNYAMAKGVIDNKWHLVTGDKKEIYDLGRNSYFVEEDLGEPLGENDFLHTENFILVDQNRRIRGIYNGLNKASINQLITDIKTLQEKG